MSVLSQLSSVESHVNAHQVLNGVHARMKLQYLKRNIVSQDNLQALNLQHFFQDLKTVSIGGNPTFFDLEILNIILDRIEKQGSILGYGYKAQNLFQRRGGGRFERELTSIYEAVWNDISEEEFDISKVLVSDQRGNIDFSQLDNLSDNIVEKFGMETYRTIKNVSETSKMKAYYLPEVEGKIDVKGYEVSIKSNASQKMLEIYNLLKNATFSAKNYDSMRIDKLTGAFVEITGSRSLALGKSNMFRAIYGTLSDLGYTEKYILRVIFSGLERIKNGESNVAEHFYHLRYIYELMGTGIKYQGQSFGNVKFLIYNDPHGNVYVKSTAQIVLDLINQVFEGENWERAISIPTTKFY